VYARELEASRREKKLARREEAVSQREALATELWAKLSAMDKILEEQRIQQTTTVERLQKLQQELEGKASDAALAEEKLKAKGESLDRRVTDLARRETELARWEKDLAFREEMLTRRGELLAEHELEVEKKEKELEEQVRQFNAAQAAQGFQAVEEGPRGSSGRAPHRGPAHRRMGRRGEHDTSAARDESHLGVGAADFYLRHAPGAGLHRRPPLTLGPDSWRPPGGRGWQALPSGDRVYPDVLPEP
jgi:hypothetical protein